MVLFGYLASVAPGLELVTSVIILPQRQTVLVAKQAAEVDVLTGGKFRLGVGIGWNHVEYQSLDIDFATRAARYEEQVEVPLPHPRPRRHPADAGATADPDLDGRRHRPARPRSHRPRGRRLGLQH